jgi:hypothetical protein
MVGTATYDLMTPTQRQRSRSTLTTSKWVLLALWLHMWLHMWLYMATLHYTLAHPILTCTGASSAPPPKKHTHMPNMRVGAYIAVHHLHLYLPTLLNLIASLSTCAAPYVGPPVADDVGDCVLDGLVSLANYICLVIFWSLA